MVSLLVMVLMAELSPLRHIQGSWSSSGTTGLQMPPARKRCTGGCGIVAPSHGDQLEQQLPANPGGAGAALPFAELGTISMLFSPIIKWGTPSLVGGTSITSSGGDIQSSLKWVLSYLSQLHGPPKGHQHPIQWG